MSVAKIAAFILIIIGVGISGFYLPKKSKHFKIQQLAPGVWAAINNDSFGHAICNAGIVDLGDKTIVFDPFMNVDAATDLKAVAKQLTGRDASIVVNSHYHNDHVRGNQVFLPATIVSSHFTKEKMAISEPEELKWEKENAPKILAANRARYKTATTAEKEEIALWIGYYDAMVTQGPLVKTTLPNLTFADSLWMHGSKRSVLLVELKDGHSPSDVVMILPKEGIAFMGDLLFEERHPYLADGKPEAWLKNIAALSNNASLQTFVPGHGEVATKATLKQMTDYIENVQALVYNRMQQQVPDSTIKKLNVPAEYASWKLKQFFEFNINYLIKHYKETNTQ